MELLFVREPVSVRADSGRKMGHGPGHQGACRAGLGAYREGQGATIGERQIEGNGAEGQYGQLIISVQRLNSVCWELQNFLIVCFPLSCLRHQHYPLTLDSENSFFTQIILFFQCLSPKSITDIFLSSAHIQFLMQDLTASHMNNHSSLLICLAEFSQFPLPSNSCQTAFP